MKERHKGIEVDCKEILIGDVEDPDFMITLPIYKWQQTDAGKYIMKHSDPTPRWVRHAAGNDLFGHRYIIKGYLTDKQVTYWNLKYT